MIPLSGASAAIAVDLTSGLEIYAHNPDQPLPPASTLKIVTALVAEQVLDPADPVTILAEDLVSEDFSRMGLEAGDVVTVQDLLYTAYSYLLAVMPAWPLPVWLVSASTLFRLTR